MLAPVVGADRSCAARPDTCARSSTLYSRLHRLLLALASLCFRIDCGDGLCNELVIDNSRRLQSQLLLGLNTLVSLGCGRESCWSQLAYFSAI